MTSNFQVKQAVNDEQLQQIAVLADTIWHEHFTSIIGTAQVEYMLDKFQSFPALKRQLTDGYEYTRSSTTQISVDTAASIHRMENYF